METSATERIEKLVPGIVQFMPNDEAYELIANKLEEQNQALKLALEALELCADRYEGGTYLGNVRIARESLAEIRTLMGEK